MYGGWCKGITESEVRELGRIGFATPDRPQRLFYSLWVALMVVLMLPGPLLSRELISREEALAVVFPGADILAERIFLTEPQMKQAMTLAGVEVPSALIARYIAIQNGKVMGYAYVDTHIVRTKKESLLILLDETGSVKRIEVIVFLEPLEYRASPEWYGQYRGKALNEDLNLQRAIRPIAGATLTAIATNQAVRRVLAIHKVLEEEGSP